MGVLALYLLIQLKEALAVLNELRPCWDIINAAVDFG